MQHHLALEGAAACVLWAPTLRLAAAAMKTTKSWLVLLIQASISLLPGTHPQFWEALLPVQQSIDHLWIFGQIGGKDAIDHLHHQSASFHSRLGRHLCMHTGAVLEHAWTAAAMSTST